MWSSFWQVQGSKAVEADKLRHFTASLTSFISLYSVDDPPRTFRKVLANTKIYEVLSRYLSTSPTLMTQLEFVRGAVELSAYDGLDLDARACALWSRTLQFKFGHASTKDVLDRALRMERKLGSSLWQVFVKLPAIDADTSIWNQLVLSMLLQKEMPNVSLDERDTLLGLLWPAYELYVTSPTRLLVEIICVS